MELLVLSLVQGFTEVLPISSTGHLAIARLLLKVSDFNLPLAAGLHGASVLAIIVWFRREINAQIQHLAASVGAYGRQLLGGENPFALPGERRVPYYLALSLAPVVLEALLLKDRAEAVFADGRAVPVLWICTGAVITATAWLTRGGRTLSELSWKEYLLIGVVQGLAVLPGVSRLGLVLCAGMWLKLNWKEALNLAFLLAVPVMMGGVLYESGDILGDLYTLRGMNLTLVLGLVVVFASSLLGLKLITSRWLERSTFIFFGFYCLLLGGFTMVFQWAWPMVG